MTLVEGAGRIMLQDEPEAADVVAQRLSEDGVDLRIGAAVERVGKTSNGVRLVLGGGSQLGPTRRWLPWDGGLRWTD